MAMTIRDAKSAPRQRNIASLVGGFVIAFGCFVLFMLVASQLTQWPPSALLFVLGALIAVAIGVWIRVADL
jgi:lipopolysaccharide export LptBFGC system permease protein LptF